MRYLRNISVVLLMLCSSDLQADDAKDWKRMIESDWQSSNGSNLSVQAKWELRKKVLSNKLLDFDDILFVKRVPSAFAHMSDQNFGWWSRPGGGIFILKNFKSESPEVVCLTSDMEPGSFMKPDLSFDGKKILFAYCKFYQESMNNPDKTDKKSLPEDAFYHIYEINVDPSTSLRAGGSAIRKITSGRYDDFCPRYLPNGEIVFLSTRRGTFVQTTKKNTSRTLDEDALPDSFVRCGGDNYRPVSVYTLHVMNSAGREMRALSPFENFEWDPVVTHDGRIMFARWDYVDRDNMPYISLWTTNPDGTNPLLVYGNFTRNPHCIFETRCIPGSHKMIFVASAHHCITGGSLVLLDTAKGLEDEKPITRLTPEVCFPESEKWPKTWYATPFPLSESVYLTSWSAVPLVNQGNPAGGSGINRTNALGLYVYDADSRHKEIIYRDPAISCYDPIPLKPRAVPPVLSSAVDYEGPQVGKMLLVNVYAGLSGVATGSVKKLRLVGVPPKVQPHMNKPILGIMRDDPGKIILGTVPVEADGSANFWMPSGMNVFFQALDDNGMAIQTMRTATYLQPGQSSSCVGCHEHRMTAPAGVKTLAASREPSKIQLGPAGSWPYRFDKLVQPVVDDNCLRCHKGGMTYEKMISYGNPSLEQHVKERYKAGLSLPGQGAAATSSLVQLLKTGKDHQGLKLTQEVYERLFAWMDLYCQRVGAYSDKQEKEIEDLKDELKDYLIDGLK